MQTQRKQVCKRAPTAAAFIREGSGVCKTQQTLPLKLQLILDILELEIRAVLLQYLALATGNLQRTAGSQLPLRGCRLASCLAERCGAMRGARGVRWSVVSTWHMAHGTWHMVKCKVPWHMAHGTWHFALYTFCTLHFLVKKRGPCVLCLCCRVGCV
jgi:hypothetical protein